MKILKSIIILCCTILLVGIISCKNKKSDSALAAIDLKRGELLLCSSEQFGEVSFSLSCSYETRETFELGLSLLHSFEYAEAEKVFVKVIDMDPDCAMAYWGVTMSIFHSLWMQGDLSYLEKGEKLLAIANTLPSSEREKDYLDAIGVFYKDWNRTDQTTRKLLYEKKMKELYMKHSDDMEAAVFYALAVRAVANPNDKTYKKQRQAGKILEELFKAHPNHPGIAHYIIHSYDYPELASMALETARRYATIAPASAHAQHMPSHIFTRLGLWDESVNTNINSVSSAICYTERVNPEANWSQEIHAVDYLVYAYLQMGNNDEAMDQLRNMQDVKEVFPKNHFASSYALIAIPVRIALENKQWKEASQLELPTIDIPWDDFPWEKSMLHFGRALGFSHLGDIVAAENELATLKMLHQEILDLKKENFEYKSGQVMIQLQAIEGWIQFAKGNQSKALAFMRKSADLESQTSKHPVTPGEVLPADELLADMLLAYNKPKEALEVYELNLKGHPNRFNGIYGAAVASERIGDDEKAAYYFELLVGLTATSLNDREEVKEAKSFLNQSI